MPVSYTHLDVYKRQALNEDMKKRFENRRQDREDEVLFEERCKLDGEEYYTGHTREYIRMAMPADADYGNKIVSVKVEKARKHNILLCSKKMIQKIDCIL